MATVDNIPVREGLDGQEQLNVLRAYLKDSDEGSYKYPDTLLIPLLVDKTSNTIWRELTGATDVDIAWSYNPLDFSKPINRLRLIINDTELLSLKYTDKELLDLLDVIPLRYVAFLIMVEDTEQVSLPEDSNNPIRVVRLYLKDEDGTVYTDYQIAKALLSEVTDPYSFVVKIMRQKSGAEAVQTSSESQGGELASLDGITFSTKTSRELLSDSIESQEAILNYGQSTIYGKGSSVYDFWMDGVSLVDENWEDEWYAL